MTGFGRRAQEHPAAGSPCPGRQFSTTLNCFWVISVDWASLASAEMQGNRTRGDDSGSEKGHQPPMTSRYAAAVNRPSTAAGSSGRISTNQPAPYGSVLITSGVSPNASLRADTVPLTGA